MTNTQSVCTPDRISSSTSTIVYRILKGPREHAAHLTWRQVLALWQAQDGGCLGRVFNHTLHDCPFKDVFWECCPVSAQSADQPFEFVLTDAGGCLHGANASTQDFSEHFKGLCRCKKSHDSESTVISFANLGRDAILVVPRHVPEAPGKSVYAHDCLLLLNAS